MREYWDDAAQRNAAWYVDTSLDYEHPDMDRFFATGQEVVARVLRECPVPVQRGLAVEIGSGLGRLALALSTEFDRVVGVDVAPEMVRQARALVTEANVQFEVGDGHTLPSLADGSADLVLSFTVFQHISDPAVIEGYMAEVGRVLRPGGAFAFQWDGRRDSLRWRVGRRARIWLQHSGILPERRRRHDPAFFGSRLPVTWVEAALGRSGLRVLHIEGAGSLWAFAWAQRQ